MQRTDDDVDFGTVVEECDDYTNTYAATAYWPFTHTMRPVELALDGMAEDVEAYAGDPSGPTYVFWYCNWPRAS